MEMREGADTQSRTALKEKGRRIKSNAATRYITSFESFSQDPLFQLLPRLRYCSKFEMRLMLRATMAVLKTKEIRPWSNATRRTYRELITTSET